ncbi:DUF1054 domain-containing protein [Ferviditalea candida]|uniref:UPF0637 protein VF724_14940 n=1 Tax=Ferviditalea candida TaxID=3108399 RepID=A0ABU5ZNS8_9BACL|nr:DUF1054 domain-containing protein [Paenibacillaceae bacterium T2]
MTIPALTPQDFDVFTIPGLEARMEQLIRQVRPKLTRIGEELGPFLSAMAGEPMFAHVAKHARRTVNPPEDSWVAWANNKKGYKAHPHFEVGLFSTHLYIQFALIYESGNKAIFAGRLAGELERIGKLIPGNYYWSEDHTVPHAILHKDMNNAKFAEMIRKLQNVKKSEVMCGVKIDRNDPVLEQASLLQQHIENTLETLMPLYRLSF